jgi:P4 family phage/plasmid primase-like protien
MNPRVLSLRSQAIFLREVWARQQIADGWVYTPYIKHGQTPRKFTPKSWKYPEQLDEIEAWLKTRDIDDVYFSPTIYRKASAQREAAYPSRVLFADFDSVDPRNFTEALQPHILWETSPASWQGIYFLEQSLPVSEFDAWNKKLTYFFAADKGCWPINHVIRIPGRKNYKPEHGEEGVEGLLHWVRNRRANLQDEAWEAIPEPGSTEAITVDVLLPTEGVDRAGVIAGLKPATKALLRREWDDRSSGCHALAKELFKAGLPADHVAAVLGGCDVFLDKYGGRADVQKELKREVERALVMLQRDGWRYDEAAATVSEPDDVLDKALGLTEAANGERLIKNHGSNLHYIPPWRAWLVWNGNFWERDHTLRVRELAKREARELIVQASHIVDKAEMNRHIRWATHSLSSRGVNGTLSSAMSLPGVIIMPNELDVDRWLFNVLNGTINLRTIGSAGPGSGVFPREGMPITGTADALAARTGGMLGRGAPVMPGGGTGNSNRTRGLQQGQQKGEGRIGLGRDIPAGFRPAAREDLITVRSEVFYDASAKCPTWDKCVQTWFPDQEVREYVQRAVGYSLTGSLEEKCFFVLQGESNAGKSVFMSVMAKIFGQYASTLKSETLEQQRFAQRNTDDLADLQGKRWVSWSELTPGMKLNTRLVKEVTGIVDAELKVMRKHETTFTYKPHFHIWVDTNDLPAIDHRDDAAFNRFKLVRFGKALPERKRDPRLILKLERELSGIFNWCLEGLRLWRDGMSPNANNDLLDSSVELGARGVGVGPGGRGNEDVDERRGLQEPQAVTEAVQEQRQTEDVFGAFLETHYVRTSTQHWVATNEIRQEYADWAGMTNLSGRAFGGMLSAKGLGSTVVRDGSKTLRAVRGLRPKRDDER